MWRILFRAFIFNCNVIILNYIVIVITFLIIIIGIRTVQRI